MIARAQELFRLGLAELGLVLDQRQMDRFARLAAELGKWNRKINLTAIATEEEIVVKHFLDSLTMARVVPGTGSLVDLGSGGGFPALPLKILFPGLQVVSVDAVEKKIIFQRQAARQLGLDGFTALHARGETLAADHGARFDWVVSRAFTDLVNFAAMAAPLVNGEGKIVAMKGKGGRDEAVAAQEPLRVLGIRLCEVIEFSLPVSGDRRSFVVMAKERR
jgi:16S rRNA (guanine527-N7)-methyltransferase